MVTKRVWLVALLVLGLYGVAIATVTMNGSYEIKGNLTVDGTCTGCGAGVLETHSASTSTSLNFTCVTNSAFNNFVFDFIDIVPTTAGLNFWMQMATGGTPTYDTGSNYSWVAWRSISNSQAAAGNTGQTAIEVDPSATDTLSNSSTNTFNGSLTLYLPSSGSSFKKVTGGPFHLLTNGSVRETGYSSGAYEQSTVVTAVRFFSGTFNTNTIASGTINCSGK